MYLSIYFYLNTKKIYYLAISFINLFLLFITFSRGSYLAFVVTLIIILFYKKIVNKNAIKSGILIDPRTVKGKINFVIFC